MGLSSGTKLGPYEIESPLGAGGMGEVYRARDTRLDRVVAIKILNSSVACSPELKQRFEREARIISRLNHPHICTLHDVGHQDETDFLVMEYLEGETLAARLTRGALLLPDLLKIAIDVLDGLEQAHRAGVVHRDLKPGNVMLTKTGAKLLDFGLAKPAGSASAAGSSSPMFSAAMTLSSPSPHSPLTTSGAVVGTVQYMAPEQFEGKEADARTDMFAFGSMLYEMATGKRPFSGKSQIKVVSAILEDDPPPASELRSDLPLAIDHVIGTCLQKIPENRYHSAHDVALELKWVSEMPKQRSVRIRRISKLRMSAIFVVGALLGVLLGGLAAHFVSRGPRAQASMLAILPSSGFAFNFSGLHGPPAISPDGTRIVLVGSDSRTRMLLIRSLDNSALTPLPGTDGASYPFWSPDGKRIGFFTGDALKIVDVAGRSVMDLCAVEQGRGGTWNSKGEIVFGTRTTGLFRIAVSGGTPIPLTRRTAREANHRFPTFLPDGNHLVYVVQSPPISQVQVVSMDDPRPAVLPGVVSNVAFSQGRIFHVRADGTLLAQRFDFDRLSLESDFDVVAKPVAYDGQFNYAAFSVSPQGAIAYEEGSGSTGNEVVRFDHAGKELGKLIALNSDTFVRISPRGDQLLYNATQGIRTDIWVAQLSRGTRTRISLEKEGGAFGIWSPDGHKVAYGNGVGGDSIVVRTSDGLGSEEVIAKMQGSVVPRSWSADGKYIVFEYHPPDPNSPGEIWVASLKPGEAPHVLLRNISSYGTDLSPDGKWLAYTSEESGRMEVYVIPFTPLASPDNVFAAGRWQISTEGGTQPKWSRTGKELFIPNPSGTTLYVASIKVEKGKLESSGVQKLFDLPLHPAWDYYDIGPDADIYIPRYIGRQSSPLTMLLNWRPRGE